MSTDGFCGKPEMVDRINSAHDKGFTLGRASVNLQNLLAARSNHSRQSKILLHKHSCLLHTVRLLFLHHRDPQHIH